MSTNYPGNIDNYTVKIDGVDTVAASHDNGDVTDRYDYSAFGNLQSHTGSDSNRIMFSSEPNDEDTGLIYLRHRYYEPDNGRFVSRDAKYSYRENLFVYCNNNPVYYVDHTGNEFAHGEDMTVFWQPFNYPVPEIKDTKYSSIIRRELNSFYKEKYQEQKNKNQLIHGNILCTDWSDFFIKTGAKKPIDNKQQKNLDYLKTKTGAYRITPFRTDCPGIHSFTYLKFEFIDGKNTAIEWWITETNAPQFLIKWEIQLMTSKRFNKVAPPSWFWKTNRSWDSFYKNI